jgi:hypothetical protein
VEMPSVAVVRRVASRWSDWVVVHPVWWGVGSGGVLVLLGFALELPPIVVLAAAVAISACNIRHAKRRGYCPLPTDPGSHPLRAESE